MASLWGYEENDDMEQLGQKLLCTTLELEKLKAEAMEEMMRNKEYVKQLIHLLKYAIQERDEARIEFQKLLNKTTTTFPSIPLFESDNNLLKPLKPNSSITESNSLSETYNYHSHGSPPTSSPDMNFDHESFIIDTLAKGRVLPQKGKFLQSVLQAGPLLQTLVVAGPLPRWRNPPHSPPFPVPPVSIKGCEVLPNTLMNSKSYAQLQPPPVLNFASLMNTNNGYVPLAKRQRFY